MFSFVKKEAYTLVVMANRTRYFANRLSITPVHSNALHGTTILASQMLKCLDFWFHLMTRLLVTPCTRCVSRELWWAPLDDFSTQLKVKLLYFRFFSRLWFLVTPVDSSFLPLESPWTIFSFYWAGLFKAELR